MDERLAVLVEGQHGVFTVRQTRELGFTPAAVQHRLRTGRWESLRPGLYRIPGSPRTWRQRLMAAILAAGPGAVASHRSAAALLGIPGFGQQTVVELTTPRTKRHRDPAVIAHQTATLPDWHVTRLDGIPTTRVARTLVDLAGAVRPQRTERAVDSCLSTGMVAVDTLRAVTAELIRPGRPGIALMSRLLDERADGYEAPASELEARFIALVHAAGLPGPVRQLDVGDADRWAGRVDFAYPDIRLLIELDSRRHHMSKLGFEADRARDNGRVAAGWRPVRFTWDQITRRPEEVVDLLLRSGVIRHRQSDVGCRRLAG